jgi:hypothetical protein
MYVNKIKIVTFTTLPDMVSSDGMVHIS